MSPVIAASGALNVSLPWVCERCEVGGSDVELTPPCWNCGGPTVQARRTTALDSLRSLVDSHGRPMAPW